MLNRRQLLQSSLVASGSLLSAETAAPALLFAQEPKAPPVKPEPPPLNRFPRMVQEWFVAQVRSLENTANAAKLALKTKADAEAYVLDVRQRIAASFGPFPERTPLNAKVTRTVERESYRIENVLFESRPGFIVSANLYLPKGRKHPLPGVVASCGHSGNGKAGETYQAFAQSLAKMGYVVLIFDPIGQGERLQYVDDNLKPRRGIGVAEHLYAGNQQFVTGEFFGSWRAWDGIRALDYLLTREEVDPKHVGITGNSGGGTMTTWLAGLDNRWTMAAPGCFVSTFRRNLENELPQDTEQCPPRAIALGLDHDDFLAALAPRPVIILAKEKDFFDVRGSQEAFERLQRLYTLLGKPENVALHVGPTEHGYSQENREAMYRWFNRATGVSDAQTEPPLAIEKDDALYASPQGQVAGLGSRTVFSFTQARAKELAQNRPALRGVGLSQAVRNVLRLPPRGGPPDYRILRPLTGRGYPKPAAASYAVETEPGAFAVVSLLAEKALVSRPPRTPGPVTLYVSHQSADSELRGEPLVRELITAEPERLFFACDVRGIGDSQPDTCGVDQFRKPYGSDYFYASHAVMLDRPYLGQKTHDLLAVLDWLADHGYRQVHLAGLGWGALPAAFAALLHPVVTQVTLKGALTSYEAIATSEAYDWPLAALPPGVLKQFDLPDVYRELAAKQLRQLEPRGASAE